MADSAKEKDEEGSEPKVEVFGEGVGADRDERKENKHKRHEFRDRFRDHYHYHHHGSLPWGLAFILVGLLLLLSNFGALPPIVWSQVIHLWPLLIILIGLDVLIGHSEIADIINSLIGLFILLTILGIIFIHTSPQLINGMPQVVQNYLYSLNNYLQIR